MGAGDEITVKAVEFGLRLGKWASSDKILLRDGVSYGGSMADGTSGFVYF